MSSFALKACRQHIHRDGDRAGRVGKPEQSPHRRCQRCTEGRRAEIGESVALVKIRHAGHPFGHLITLCAEHAEQWRPAADA